MGYISKLVRHLPLALNWPTIQPLASTSKLYGGVPNSHAALDSIPNDARRTVCWLRLQPSLAAVDECNAPAHPSCGTSTPHTVAHSDVDQTPL